MKDYKCSHVRVRNFSESNFYVEEFINSVEKQYNVDFRKLPRWKEIIQKLESVKTFYNIKFQTAYERKSAIIDKIYLQNTRLSPFELTEKLARTAKKWDSLSKKHQISTVTFKDTDESVSVLEGLENNEGIAEEEDNLTAHLNTEVSEPVTKVGLSTLDLKSSPSSQLPVNICTNDHKFISPFNSEDTSLKCKIPLSKSTDKVKEKEWLTRIRATSIICEPEQITIYKNSVKKQVLNFTILNYGTDFLNCRYKCLTNSSPFKEAQVIPKTPQKLYPGIPVTYRFIFTLEQNEENTEFTSELFFRVSKNTLKGKPVNAFCVSIISKLNPYRSVSVSEIVEIPSVYPWLVKRDSGYSTGHLYISIDDDCSYELRITKQYASSVTGFQEPSMDTINPISLDTKSIFDRLGDKMLADDFIADEEEASIKTIDVINMFVQEIVERSLDVFVFKRTNMILKPRSIYKIPVCFTKGEHIGKHQCYYDCEFFDIYSGKLVITKTTRIFAEVLPHPVQITPNFLDLTQTPVTHGLIEDSFTISNNHIYYPVNVKIKLTTKMRRLFKVDPVDVTIPTTSKVKFRLRLCSRDNLTLASKYDEFVHFTVKIILNGNKEIYDNVPPMFYEIIAPCIVDYRRVYNVPLLRNFSNSKSNSDEIVNV